MAESYLTGSVGQDGDNVPKDVELVHRMLQLVPWHLGGPVGKLSPKIRNPVLTARAIKRFQRYNKLKPTHRIEPGDATEDVLVELLLDLGKIFDALEGRPDLTAPPGATRSPRKPVLKGEMTPIRREFLSKLLTLMPGRRFTKPAETPKSTKDGDKDAPKATGCGGLPGRIWRMVGVPGKSEHGAIILEIKLGGASTHASPSGHDPNWHALAPEIDRRFGSNCWVPFRPGLLPKPGDIYVQLYGEGERRGWFRHVGIVFSVRNGKWLTADAGQGTSGWDLAWNERPVDENGQSTNARGELRKLAGWCDIDELYSVIVSQDPLRYRI